MCSIFSFHRRGNGQTNRYDCAAAFGIPNIKNAAVPPDNLIAHRKADAAAAGLGAALIKLLLDKRKLRLRNTGAVVPDAQDIILPLPLHGGGDSLSGAAMLGRIIQHIAEHLLQPLRVAGDGIGIHLVAA